MNELSAMLALHLAFPFSPKQTKRLLDQHDCIQTLLDREATPSSPLFKILEKRSWEEEQARAAEKGIDLISLQDPRYPQSLKQLSDPPLILYVLGELLPSDQTSIGIVGTRTASTYGKSMAEDFGRSCAAKNVTVVSGLARGIDTAAHEGALKAGRTLAVLGSGLADIYPKENIFLAKEIAKQGALLSEYPLFTPPDRFQFPRRNRLIAALSSGCLLVEGAEKSGGMITIDWALQLNKPCFALPGRVDMESFKGNHFLIKSHKARLVENAEEMISLLMPEQKWEAILETVDRISLSTAESSLVTLFPKHELSFDELVIRSKLPTSTLNALLVGLLLKGVLRQLPGNAYKKV